MGNRYVLTGCTTATATELRCSSCREWMPDDAFPRNNTRHNVGRRARASECRACAAARRRAARARDSARQTHGKDAQFCTRANCADVAVGHVTWGTWLREIPLATHGRRALDEEGRAPLCSNCLAVATGRRHLVSA